MGSTSMYRAPGQRSRDIFQEQLLFQGDEFLACTTRNSVFYAAVRSSTTGRVWALVVKFDYHRGSRENFSFRAMVEDEGPVYTECPASVLDLLSETQNENAIAWRAKCRTRLAVRKAASAVKVGDTVRFDKAVPFQDGSELDVFRYLGKSLFTAAGLTYQISGWRDRPLEVVPATA